MSKKNKLLEKKWDGWMYLWIQAAGEEEFWIREVFQSDNLAVSWTESEVSPMADVKVLEYLIAMLKDGVTFTEKELIAWNTKVNEE